MDHRQNRVHIDGALRIILEEGAGTGGISAAAAGAIGRHPVREAECTLDERYRHCWDDLREHRPDERALKVV